MKLNKVVLTEGLKTIGKEAFLGCEELKQINIPKSVAQVGEDAFGFTYANEQKTKVSGFSMSVFSRSAAEKYAKANSIEYTAKDVNIAKFAFIAAMVGIIIAVIVFAIVLMKRSKKTAPTSARKAAKEAAKKAAKEAKKNEPI